MKCPSCGYNSFDHLELCKKCGSPLNAAAAPPESESGKKARKKSRGRAGNDSGEPLTGELFLDIPIREANAESYAESGQPAAPRHKRTDGRDGDLPHESYELFPLSKEVDTARYGEEGPEGPSRVAPGSVPVPEEDLPDLRQDPFAVINDEEALYERDSGKIAGYYEREADVYNLAGFISRAFAMIIDIAIVSLIALLAVIAGLVIVYGFNFGAYGSADIMLPLYLVLFLLSSTYFVFLHGYGGKTAGKALLGIKLINNEGEGVGLWQAFVRWIGYYISGVFLFAGFLWSLVDSECQTWHDKIAGTYVVKD